MNIGDIQTKIYNLTKTNSSTFPNSDMLIDINIAYNRIIDKILEADGRWQWDDLNYNDLPIGTTTVTQDQQDYRFDNEHLTVDRVEIQDSNGEWTKLRPIDEEDELYFSLTQISDDKGVPDRYDVVGRSIFLYPVPNYTKSSALKVYFQRGPDEFTSAELTAGTKVPGFASTFHHLIAYMVALDYGLSNNLKNASSMDKIIERDMEKLEKFYAKRHKEDRSKISTRKELYI